MVPVVAEADASVIPSKQLRLGNRSFFGRLRVIFKYQRQIRPRRSALAVKKYRKYRYTNKNWA